MSEVSLDADVVCGYLLGGLLRAGFELTPREMSICACVFLGMEQAEIAATIHITIPTIKRHIANVLLKIGVHTTLQIVAIAYKHSTIYWGRNVI